MEQIIKVIISWINLIRLIPHCILLGVKWEKCKSDIEVNSPSFMGRYSLFTRWLYLMAFDKFYRALFYHRIGKWHFLIDFLCPAHSCFYISPSTKIGKGFKCCHPFSTVINAESIGDNVAVFQDVTIGVNAGKRPIIGNDVQIYTNSVVLGGITVGDGTVVGACTLVNKNTPPYSVIVGIPGNVLKTRGVEGVIEPTIE